jgi:hypothetical protein
MNYAAVFQYAGDKFWEKVEALRRTKLKIKERLRLAREALEEVKRKVPLQYPLPDNFVIVFVEAVCDKSFPQKPRARARFLGDSLGADGMVSARRSRNICGEERAKLKKKQTAPKPEIYIDCCGKKRWTVGQVCPECGRNPLDAFMLFLSPLLVG